MNVSGELAKKITGRLMKFSPLWTALSDERREVAIKVLIMCEMVGGRDKAWRLLGVTDNTIDNYRRGSREIKHRILVTLTEHAELPLSALNYRWTFEGETLLFHDAQGSVVPFPLESPAQTSGPRFDDPPWPYAPGFDESAPPEGFSGSDNSPTVVLNAWFRSHLQLDPKHVMVLIAKDGAMNPAIADGTPVFLDTSDRELSDGCVYAVRVDDDFIIRRVCRLKNGGIELIASGGETYPPQKIRKPDVPDLQVVGRVRFPPTA